MRVPRSVVVLRVCCLVALLASAALTADTLNPGRRFCPLDAACAKARDSALGSFFGVPTSVLGLAAFAGLFLLTLLPVGFARKVTRPAAWAAGAAGLAFVGYQGLVLGTFCPLCLVADLCGLGAAAAAFAWPPPLLYRGRAKKKPPALESVPARLRWALVAQVVVGAPLLWPSPPAKPSWVELPVGANPSLASIDVEAEFAPFLVERTTPADDALPVLPPDDDDVPSPRGGRSVADVPAAPPEDGPGAAGDPSSSVPALPRPVPTPVRAAPPPVAVIAPPRPSAREIVVLEYLNAFCTHCRATHARLDRVVAGFDRPVRRHRVYVWSSNDVPLWAKACAVAAVQGREDEMFDALLETDRQDDRSIRAAAARAGVDLAGIDAPEVAARLARDRRLSSQARLEGLPTFDVGRRRLMGEQSEGELLEALRAAVGG